jgi:predicted AAA+ superfamily ATPase
MPFLRNKGMPIDVFLFLLVSLNIYFLYDKTIKKSFTQPQGTKKVTIKWKDRKGRKPLLLEGARQVGKTCLLNKFGKRYFKNVAYINFQNPSQEIRDQSVSVFH